MELKQRLSDIKTAWIKLKESDPHLSVPGAQAHRYHVDAENIPAELIGNFESRNGFVLPEEYREYLIQVSNGGVSPYTVMFPLHDALYPLSLGQQDADWLRTHPDHYKNEFPVTEEQVIGCLTYRINNPTAETPPIAIDADAPGYLFLCEGEHGDYYIMPVNGVCKSEVWILRSGTRKLENGEEKGCFWVRPEIKWNEDQINIPSFLTWIEDAQAGWSNANKSLAKRLGAVKTTWHKLKAQDPNQAVFGAFMHHYDFSQALTETDVAAYEAQYHITLPEEYREYLKRVSNGGAGPFYGMYPLTHAVMALNSGNLDEGNFYEYLKHNPEHLSKPFQVTDAELDAYLTKKANKQETGPILMDKKAGGYLFLAEYGCGGYFIMPVNGNGVGEVWFLQKPEANKLTYVIHDSDGNEVESGSYGSDEEGEQFLLYPELKWNAQQASTVNFLEWMEHRQRVWFDDLIAANAQQNNTAGGTGGAAVDLQNETAYYPLAVGNTWTYSMQPEGSFTNAVTAQTGPAEFVLNNSISGNANMLKHEGNYLTDSHEKGTMQLMLRDASAVGETWEIKFKANGFDNILAMTVKEALPSKTVGDKTYTDVLMVESESKMVFNGTLMPLNFFTQYYYAKGVGLILTTSSGGGNMAAGIV